MNTEHQITTDKISLHTSQAPAKEPYHAPLVKVHGKLERMTLQDTSPGSGGGGGGGTPIIPEE